MPKPTGLSRPYKLHLNLTVIETAEPHLLAELRADPRVGPLIAAPLSDTAAAATPAQTEALVRQLVKGGYVPKVVE